MTATLHAHWEGYCPICQNKTAFVAYDPWFCDHLHCVKCEGGSIPRERAVALVLKRLLPEWQHVRIHESSPSPRGVSELLRKYCKNLIQTQYYPDVPSGEFKDGFRCENLEKTTFPDEHFDVVISQHVMEHVFDPAAVYRDVWRTLRPGGLYIHSVPIYKTMVHTVQRTALDPVTKEFIYIKEPVYHHNPASEEGAIVTFDYGYEYHDQVASWADFSVEILRFNDRYHGIVAEFSEVVVCRKF